MLSGRFGVAFSANTHSGWRGEEKCGPAGPGAFGKGDTAWGETRLRGSGSEENAGGTPAILVRSSRLSR